MMKRAVLLFAAVAAMVLAGCKEKKAGNADIITTDYEVPTPSDTPIAMGSYTEQKEVEWVEGRSYRVTVTRMAVDSLPKVSDEIGQKYVDNQVTVTVTRADNTVFFSRSFVKSSFAGWVDADYRQHALLEGIRFLKVEGDKLVFVAWLNYPQSGDDEAQELLVKLSRMGEVVIERYSENDRDDLQQMDEEA